MKQHDRHNDDELYQQIMAELRPGADEYDRLMAAGQNPGAMRATRRLIFRYAAAACALIAISTLALVLWQTERQQQVPQMAHQELPTSIPGAPPEGSPRGTDAYAPQTPKKRFPVGNLQEAPKGPQKALQAPQKASGDEGAIQAEIMAQIEEEMARAMAEEELMRVMIEDELIQEVVATALRDIEQPQTIQFSL